jgi:uncharacterized protein YjbI with pentapeptide repeats
LLGVRAWNAWRGMFDIRADLIRADLIRADLIRADLSGADLIRADLRRADLSGADLSRADLSGADLSKANLSGANLSGADLSKANLSRANLSGADLSGADMDRVRLFETVFADVDLSSCKGRETCTHTGPSTVDVRTLQRSGPLPLVFLRGVGLPDNLIDYVPSLLNQAIQHYSCFISYSSKDEEFVRRLHADLQAKGVRCWFAQKDMRIGARIWDTIDEAIRLRDKVLLVLSETAIASDWVEDEVTRAFAEERDRGTTVLFPVRIDDAVLKTPEPWARKLRDSRHIGDFRRWKQHDVYQEALDRVLRDLQMPGS